MAIHIIWSRQITLGIRILKVADIFQALVQKRPYKDSMPLEQVMGILGDLAAQSKIDNQVMALVCSSQQGVIR